MARSKHPERTIEQILTISEKLFIERGYEKTTMQDILNELKMSKGAIYHHFKSKEEILQTIIDKKVNREKTLLHDLAARTHAENAREKISQILSEFLVNEADAFNSAPKSLMLSTIKDPNIVVASLQTSVLDMAPTLSKLRIGNFYLTARKSYATLMTRPPVGIVGGVTWQGANILKEP